MNDIKFRYVIKNEYTNQTTLLHLTLGEVQDMDFSDFPFLKGDSFTVDRFTGLEDKKGVDIYENDLIINHQTGDLPNQPGLVSFEYGGWHYDCYHASSLPLDRASGLSEVIGNAHTPLERTE